MKGEMETHEIILIIIGVIVVIAIIFVYFGYIRPNITKSAETEIETEIELNKILNLNVTLIAETTLDNYDVMRKFHLDDENRTCFVYLVTGRGVAMQRFHDEELE